MKEELKIKLQNLLSDHMHGNKPKPDTYKALEEFIDSNFTPRQKENVIQSYRKDVIDFFDMCVIGENTVQVKRFTKHLDELIAICTGEEMKCTHSDK